MHQPPAPNGPPRLFSPIVRKIETIFGTVLPDNPIRAIVVRLTFTKWLALPLLWHLAKEEYLCRFAAGSALFCVT